MQETKSLSTSSDGRPTLHSGSTQGPYKSSKTDRDSLLTDIPSCSSIWLVHPYPSPCSALFFSAYSSLSPSSRARSKPSPSASLRTPTNTSLSSSTSSPPSSAYRSTSSSSLTVPDERGFRSGARWSEGVNSRESGSLGSLLRRLGLACGLCVLSSCSSLLWLLVLVKRVGCLSRGQSAGRAEGEAAQLNRGSASDSASFVLPRHREKQRLN